MLASLTTEPLHQRMRSTAGGEARTLGITRGEEAPRGRGQFGGSLLFDQFYDLFRLPKADPVELVLRLAVVSPSVEDVDSEQHCYNAAMDELSLLQANGLLLSNMSALGLND